MLTGAMAKAYISGLQFPANRSSTPFLKTVATAKHFLGYTLDRTPPRLNFLANISATDIAQTYTPAFAQAVATGVRSVMCAYSGVNGHPSCASQLVETDILRTKMDFSGFIVSDCGAVEFIQSQYHLAPTIEDAVAWAMR